MRKLTAAQIATMTASVTASISMVAATTTRFGIPMLGLAALAHADTYGDDELEEIVVTGYTGSPWTVEIYHPGTSGYPSTGGGSPTPPTAPPVARAPTNAPIPVQRNATRCAMRYSVDVNETNPHGQGGQAPNFRTVFQPGYAWAANNVNIQPPVIVTTTNVAPDSGHTGHALGYTSFSEHISYVYTNEVQRHATANGVDYEADLVNTIVHEWAHSWWSPWDESVPTALGYAAQAMYQNDGGAGAECNTRPVHNGNLGGHK